MATVASGLNSGSGYNSSDTITSTTLNNHVNNATVTNIQPDDIASSTNKTTGVTFAKMQFISTEKVLARTSSNDGVVEEIDIAGASGILLDEDTLSSDSNTRGATQQSIKTYVDNEIAAKKVNCLLTNTSSSVTVSSVPFTVPFDSEISDSSNLHDNSTNNSRITIGTAGVYIINSIIATLETTNGDFGIAIFKNGSEIARVHGDYNSINTSTVHINICHTALLSASDYLEVKLMDISGNSTTINGTRTYFNATLVS
jgi:hypothetical protein